MSFNFMTRNTQEIAFKERATCYINFTSTINMAVIILTLVALHVRLHLLLLVRNILSLEHRHT